MQVALIIALAFSGSPAMAAATAPFAPVVVQSIPEAERTATAAEQPATAEKRPAPPLAPVVECEEAVYSWQPADNGAGPMWCHGNTCLVRAGDELFASGLETIPGAKPLNNCVPLLYHRAQDGWRLVYRGEGRTREPCPLAVFPGGEVLLSINPTLTAPDTYNGPSRPQVLAFQAAAPEAAPVVLEPAWRGTPAFTEHSYRSFAADGARRELILLQNIGYAHAEWSFRNAQGDWSASGALVWPWGKEYDTPQPIRLCYPAVALADRAVHFLGVSDIIEPYAAWRDYKRELTGRQWDYDFRRLFYTWSDDITGGDFHEWVEIASRDATCGWIFPMDLAVRPGGDVYALWTERAIDERLRAKFFPGARQRHALELAVIRKGAVTARTTILEGGEDLGGERPGGARFHTADDGRLFVVYHAGGAGADGKALAELRVAELFPGGRRGEPVAVTLQTPLSSFFTTTPRAGCRPSRHVELLGAAGTTMRYARIRLW